MLFMEDNYVIQKARQAGKTTELINLAFEKDGYIICHCKDEAKRIFSKAKEMGKHIRLPLTYPEFINYRGYRVPFYFDNFDMFVQSLIQDAMRGKEIEALTLTYNKILLNRDD